MYSLPWSSKSRFTVANLKVCICTLSATADGHHLGRPALCVNAVRSELRRARRRMWRAAPSLRHGGGAVRFGVGRRAWFGRGRGNGEQWHATCVGACARGRIQATARSPMRVLIVPAIQEPEGAWAPRQGLGGQRMPPPRHDYSLSARAESVLRGGTVSDGDSWPQLRTTARTSGRALSHALVVPVTGGAAGVSAARVPYLPRMMAERHANHFPCAEDVSSSPLPTHLLMAFPCVLLVSWLSAPPRCQRPPVRSVASSPPELVLHGRCLYMQISARTPTCVASARLTTPLLGTFLFPNVATWLPNTNWARSGRGWSTMPLLPSCWRPYTWARTHGHRENAVRHGRANLLRGRVVWQPEQRLNSRTGAPCLSLQCHPMPLLAASSSSRWTAAAPSLASWSSSRLPPRTHTTRARSRPPPAPWPISWTRFRYVGPQTSGELASLISG